MITLPRFAPSEKELIWVKNERRTARVIRLLWQHSTPSLQRDPDFLKMLIRSTWVNNGSEKRALAYRNEGIASWLGLGEKFTNSELANALRVRLRLSLNEANWVVRNRSGITRFYNSHRSIFLAKVETQTKQLTQIFREISRNETDVEAKIKRVSKLVSALRHYRTPNGGKASMMNGLAPALACLDPQKRYPLVNARTTNLLKAIGHKADSEGIASLSRLIGKYGINDSFHLDVYASTLGAIPIPPKLRKPAKPTAPHLLGLKSEEESYATFAKRKVIIRKRHNELTNKFWKAVEWKYKPFAREYDILIEGWQAKRWLLIEAKSETKGVLGRTQIRQAIGQLFDYRWLAFKKEVKNVDIALLTPTKPASDILNLLRSLSIEALWFDGKKLCGTISLLE